MKIAIIGGGASGLACAVKLKNLNSNFQVTIFEKNDRVGKKLLATGNGRCNLSNMNTSKNDYLSVSGEIPVFRYSHDDIIDFFYTLGVVCYSDDEGRVYPLSNQAKTILDVLRLKCECSGVVFETNLEIDSVSIRCNKYIINNQTFDVLILAVGGKSQVKSYNAKVLCSSLDHSFSTIKPSLVKLTTSSSVPKILKGVRANVSLRLEKDGKLISEEQGEIIFSDNTISGICIMQFSNIIAYNGFNLCELIVDFAPQLEFDDLHDIINNAIESFSDSLLENLLSGIVPKKIGVEIIKNSGIKINRTCKSLLEHEIKAIIQSIKHFSFDITGTKDFNEAQVMLGGVKLSEINNNTLESLKHKNLYFCGEVLDVTGFCGGYNLQWAWNSALTVADSINNKNRNYDKNK